MKRFPWIHMRKKTDPELPLEPPMWLGNQSNGEYFKFATKKDRKMRKLILETADANARKLGMDRRDFLASSMGMATTLWVANQVSACSSGDEKGKGSGSSDKDAGYNVPKDATLDHEIACDVLSGNEFIFDVQTHWFSKDDMEKNPGYVGLFGTLFDRATEDTYVRQMFCESETTMSALTAWPGVACVEGRDVCGLPLDNDTNAASRERINHELAMDTQRVVSHFQVMVQDPDGVEGQLTAMEVGKENLKQIAAWKMYPGFQPIFQMDDAKGRAVIEKGLALGVPLFCIHKGLPIGPFFSVEGNHPRDIGVVAKDYKDTDAKFIIYHSAIDANYDPDGKGAGTTSAPPEGPWDESDPDPIGVNSLIRSLMDNGVGPNENVFAEIGSAINQVWKDPVATAHFFGKLMKYIGADNVVWGTDCVIYGSPQPYIDWFRTAEIPQSMQDDYGYPALDDAAKAKIFGLNAARIYGVDVEATRCKVNTCPTALLKRRLDEEVGPNRTVFEPPRGPLTWREYVEHSRRAAKSGRPG